MGGNNVNPVLMCETLKKIFLSYKGQIDVFLVFGLGSRDLSFIISLYVFRGSGGGLRVQLAQACEDSD